MTQADIVTSLKRLLSERVRVPFARAQALKLDTPLLKDVPKDFLRTLSPLGQIAAAQEIAEAVFYLTQASQVTGEVLHVDGGQHLGRW